MVGSDLSRISFLIFYHALPAVYLPRIVLSISDTPRPRSALPITSAPLFRTPPITFFAAGSKKLPRVASHAIGLIYLFKIDGKKYFFL
jgi:hypothetical protein